MCEYAARARVLAILLSALGLSGLSFAACQSSSTSVTSPSPAADASRCAVTATAGSPTMDASGGSGMVSVVVSRECSWAAKSTVDWITLTASTSGQGNGTVPYSVAANAVVSARQGQIVVNSDPVTIQQAAAACMFRIDRQNETFDASGGSQPIA